VTETLGLVLVVVFVEMVVSPTVVVVLVFVSGTVGVGSLRGVIEIVGVVSTTAGAVGCETSVVTVGAKLVVPRSTSPSANTGNTFTESIAITATKDVNDFNFFILDFHQVV
jgi:hypothetical protein